MRRLHAPDLLQSPPAQLPRLDGRLAVLGEVSARRRVVVDPDGDFGKARAERAVGEEPVCDYEGGCVVGWLLASVGSLEAEEGEGGRCHCLICLIRFGFGPVWLVVGGKDEKEESE